MSECKCFDEVLGKVTDNLKGQLPENEAASFEAEWQNKSIVLGEKELTTKIGLPISYEFQKIKKSGEPYKNLTKDSIKVMMIYCPFCGESLKKSDKEQAS
ncbi:hypothetical protein [Spongiibacter sp.]|uniref:hypothetical protein n=1 Tax=Spongiibacter sp. TaxID=2024860 RepID=UPI000C3D1106|nr:hypothetical protein [Spongiibacter sp.]MBU71878.1 hypothetical protein [Spongiibacter sp.]HCP22321.1 hypothetical protein [Marinobacter nauticus]|tara:strand:- start:334 stop:633 length:300 start_codon:yes stop_codon:yes gene_type:complete